MRWNKNKEREREKVKSTSKFVEHEENASRQHDTTTNMNNESLSIDQHVPIEKNDISFIGEASFHHLDFNRALLLNYAPVDRQKKKRK